MKKTFILSILILISSCTEDDFFEEILSESTISLSGDLNFGNIEVNQSATRTLTISNIGLSDLTVSGITNPNGFSSSYGGTIKPGNSVDVTVVFSPTSEKNYNGSLTVEADNDNGVNEINCFGNGIDNNSSPFGVLKVVNSASYSRYFHIKKQSDLNYDSDNQIVVDAGQTSYYYDLAIGIYLYEASNSTFYFASDPHYSSGQVKITGGDTTTVTILK